jgi:hypothetical protein
MPDTQIVTDSKNDGEVSCMGGYEGKVSGNDGNKKKETGKHGKRYVQRDCIRHGRIRRIGIRQCRKRGTLPRASPKDRYPAWQDT